MEQECDDADGYRRLLTIRGNTRTQDGIYTFSDKHRLREKVELIVLSI